MNVLVTRPFDAFDTLPDALRLAGASVAWRPTIEIDLSIPTPELDRALATIESFDWVVLTSTNAVSSFWHRVEALGLDRSRIDSRSVAAVGPATAAALSDLDIEVTFTAQPHSAEGLIAGFARRLRGRRPNVLYPRAAKVLPTLVEGLRQLGARVTDITAYEPRPLSLGADFAAAVTTADCVVFCSPSAVHAALAFRSQLARRTIACIGHTTAAAAKAVGLPVAIVPEHPTAGSLAGALVAHLASVGR